MESAPSREPLRWESRLAVVVFVVALAFHAWAMTVGWQSRHFPANEFRETQTALSAYWIKADHDFSLAYPTPVVGKPWSMPMEFPLYQWTTVVVSDLTNWSLTKAGRAVGIACFYLALPAVFMLLRRWNVAPAWRWLVLAVVVTCPLYIYYARTFLIETMALMFSLWFWVAFERAVSERNRWWLAVAVLAGTGAGLVKVTTFMLYLVPSGAWAVGRLWRERATWKTELAWMAGAVALPFAATLWWLRFADATKELNPLGRAFTSAGLREFNLGTTATRFSGALWETKAGIVTNQLSWWPVLALCGLVALVAGRTRWRAIAACLGCFALVLVCFPVLYAYHVYYYVANTALLLIAMGLALVALAESRVPRGVVWAAIALVLGGQGARYLQHYYPTQSMILPGGDGLTTALRTLTNPRDVIVVLGLDWNSTTPFYAQRRSIMLRDDIARDNARVEQALALLDDEKIGALVVFGKPDGQQWLIDRAAARGLSHEPLFLWRDARVFVPQARWDELLESLLDNRFPDARLAPNVAVPQGDLRARWRDVGSLRKWQKEFFSGMKPEPVRYFASFGPATDGSSGTLLYGAHPTTRLVFALPAGAHTLRATLELPADAWRLENEHTDGVEVTLFALGKGGEKQVLATRDFNPRDNEADRGPGRPLEFKFTLPVAGEVELYFGPGKNGRDTRDWIMLGPLTID